MRAIVPLALEILQILLSHAKSVAVGLALVLPQRNNQMGNLTRCGGKLWHHAANLHLTKSRILYADVIAPVQVLRIQHDYPDIVEFATRDVGAIEDIQYLGLGVLFEPGTDDFFNRVCFGTRCCGLEKRGSSASACPPRRRRLGRAYELPP